MMKDKRTGFDELDLLLLQALEEDCSQTQAALGDRLGASEATIRRRMRRLKSRNALIQCGIPDLTVLGFDSVALMGINTEFERRAEIVSWLVQNPRIRYVCGCTGRFDLLLFVANRSTEELSNFLEELLALSGMQHIETFLSLRVHKYRPWVIGKTGT